MKVRNSERSSLKCESGLTMLEVVVALAILGIGIVGVLRAFSSSMMTCKAAEMHSYAATLAQQAASELERRSDLQSGKLSGGFAEAGRDYTWEAEVEPPGAEGLLRTQVTVFWQDGNRSRHLTMFTCLRPKADEAADAELPAGPSVPSTPPEGAR